MLRAIVTPYDWNEKDNKAFELLQYYEPDAVTIMSHTDRSLYERLHREWPVLEWYIRVKVGPKPIIGGWSFNTLDYKEWSVEHSLRQAIEYVLGIGKKPRIIMGNEPDIELPNNADDEHERQVAVRFYKEWYTRNLNIIRNSFDVEIAVAPLSQGGPLSQVNESGTVLSYGRFDYWRDNLRQLYAHADFIAEHCYFKGGDLKDTNWALRYPVWFEFGKPVDITELNDDGTLFDMEIRPNIYAQYLKMLDWQPEIRSAHIFTLPGGKDDRRKPAWWFLDSEILVTVHDALKIRPVIDYRLLAKNYAEQYGINSTLFERQIQQESGFRHWNSDGSILTSTAGARGIAQLMPQFYAEEIWSSPERSLQEAARVMAEYLNFWDGDWAKALSSYNAGLGATKRFLDKNDPLMPYQETINYVSIILDITAQEARGRLMPPVQSQIELKYNPNVPTVYQTGNWQCAAASAAWAFQSIGFNLGQDDVVRLLGDRISVQYGLMQGDGSGLAAMFREQGLQAINEWISWDWLVEHAGSMPILIGGVAWNHWVGVRDKSLRLANPAPTWKNVGSKLSKDEFDRWGPFAAVYVLMGENMQRIKELEIKIEQQAKQIESMQITIDWFVTNIAVITDDIGDMLRKDRMTKNERIAIANRLQAMRKETIGPRL